MVEKASACLVDGDRDIVFSANNPRYRLKITHTERKFADRASIDGIGGALAYGARFNRSSPWR